MEFSYEVKIPKERVAVLLGTKGSMKKKIEKSLDIRLNVDSEEGDVVLQGEDSLSLMTGQNIVKAIGRGFNPEIAIELLDEENCLELINIDDYSGDSKDKIIRLRARVIGTGGKARTTIEELTGTKIVVYGKTIGMIGNYEGVALARKAFESLLGGSRHTTVYIWLEKHRKDIRYKMY